MIKWEEHKEDCCVVVPVYDEDPSKFELLALKQCVKVFGARRDIYLIAPPELNLDAYFSFSLGYKFKVKRFADGFFDGIKGYNELCKRWEFYNAFDDYRYMLIYQLDCWAFEDRIDYFVGLGYDYFGAPWIEIEHKDNKLNIVITGCGNGGFSLRNIKKFTKLCKKHKDLTDDEASMAEDVFFCKNHKDELNICPDEIGWQFSFEAAPQVFYKLNKDKLPMGCHKPFVFAFSVFWKNYIDITSLL